MWVWDSPAAIRQLQPLVWHRRLQSDEMPFDSSRSFPAGIVLMETASETFPFAAPNP